MKLIIHPLIQLYVFSLFIHQATSIRCLSCIGVSEPRLCPTVRTCQANDVCGIQQYRTINDDVIYDIGCVSDTFCQTNTSTSSEALKNSSHSDCNECCTTDLCNTLGCGSQDNSSAQGPICFTCNRQTNPEDCQNVAQCQKDESCGVFFSELFGTKVYSSRCVTELECRLASVTSTEVGKRNLRFKRAEKICSNCCQQDFCNERCENEGINGTTISTTSFPGVSGTTSFPGRDSSGHEFIVQFLPNILGYSVKPVILMASSVNGTYSLEGPNFDNTGNISVGLTTLQVNNSDLPNQNIIENKAFYIRTSVPISLFSINYEDYTTDMSLIFPVEICSRRYIVPSYIPYYNGTIGISSLNNDTNITIILKLTSGHISYNGHSYTDGDTLDISLQRLQTFTLSHKQDLSGTQISSTKPVCVTSGCECTFVKSVACNHLEEMIPPVEQFSTEFIVPSVYTRTGVVIRIMSYNKITKFNYTIGDIRNSKTLNPYNYIDIDVKSAIPVPIVSNEPVIVTMYPLALPYTHGDPFMVLVPGVDQYLSKYNFVVPDFRFTSYISVVMLSENNDATGILLDGKPLQPFRNSSSSVLCNMDRYDVVSASVSPGAHVMNHINGSSFAVFVYGNAAGDGYGFIAGMKFK